MKTFLTVSLLCFIFPAFSQIKQMETDRPGQTNTPITIPAKWIQLETGFSRYSDKINPPSSEHYFQHPSLVVKYGLSNLIELRLLTDYATYTEKVTNGTFSNSGIDKFQLGGKVNFLKEKGARPAAAFIASYHFNRLRTLYKDSVDGASLRLALKNSLTDKLWLGYNIGIEWTRFGSNATYIYTLSPKFLVGEKCWLHAEIYGYIWNDRPPQHMADAGIAWQFTDNFKADASLGFGISKEAYNNFYSLGVAFRFR